MAKEDGEVGLDAIKPEWPRCWCFEGEWGSYVKNIIKNLLQCVKKKICNHWANMTFIFYLNCALLMHVPIVWMIPLEIYMEFQVWSTIRLTEEMEEGGACTSPLKYNLKVLRFLGVRSNKNALIFFFLKEETNYPNSKCHIWNLICIWKTSHSSLSCLKKAP